MKRKLFVEVIKDYSLDKRKDLTINFMIDGSSDNYETYKYADLDEMQGRMTNKMFYELPVVYQEDNEIGLDISYEDFQWLFKYGIKPLNI